MNAKTKKRSKQSQPKEKTILLKGVIASPGIAAGKCFRHQIDGFAISHRSIEVSEIDKEIARLKRAISSAKKELQQIRQEADRSVGAQLAKIFEAQLLILEDDAFLKQVADDISRDKVSAEYAYHCHIQQTLKALQASRDSYLREMVQDIEATAAKVFSYLVGSHANRLMENRGRIAIAENFTPGEIVLMNKYHIGGFATTFGGPTSHMALIAKSLGIPAVVGVGDLLQNCPEDATVIINGDEGEIIVNPEASLLKRFQEEQKRSRGVLSRQLRSIAQLPSATKDGRPIDVLVNLEIPTEIDQTLSTGKIGVGLYRTEFFYLSGMRFPSEEEQTKLYRDIARTFFPNPVTFRVFDLGSDKVVGDWKHSEEANPALGWRGIRFDLDAVDIFKSQIRALLCASEFRNVKIMLPMVSSISEIIEARRILKGCMAELEKKKMAFDHDVELGIMIEVPSAALMAEELAKHCDFFSIGTNDLVQYTLAVDRGNKKVALLYRELHPAVLKLIKRTIDAGIANKIGVSLCGELGGRTLALPLLVGMGLTMVSVNPPLLSEVKKTIGALTYSDCQKLAEEILMLPSAEKVESALEEWHRKHLSG